MPGERRLLIASVLACVLGGSCFRPTVSFQVVRRASPAFPGGGSDSDSADDTIALPRAPLLNRYDVVERRLAAQPDRPRCPAGFRDYVRSVLWHSSIEAERAALVEVGACTETATDAPPETADAPVTVSTAVFSFIHLSDVQLREATAKLGDERQSKGLDAVIDSFEHDLNQELYLDAVLEALMRTINKTLREPPAWVHMPSFTIHTGDAIDAGLTSELETFVRLLDLQRRDDDTPFPWLSVVGNHDVLTFGNMIPGYKMSSHALLMGYEAHLLDRFYGPVLGWVANADIYTEPTVDLARCQGCTDELVANRAQDEGFVRGFVERHCRGPATTVGARTSRCHGFDLFRDAQGLAGRRPGYYHFAIDTGAATARYGFTSILVVVLDTSDFGHTDLGSDSPLRGGEGGFMGKAQLDWLDQAVLGFRGDAGATNPAAHDQMVVVFGHHPLDTFRTDGNGARLANRLLDLARQRRLIGYFTGHRHRHHLTLHCSDAEPSAAHPRPASDLRRARACPAGAATNGFWEIETGSIISLPQEARLVTLRAVGPELGFIELVPFAHQVNLDGTSRFKVMLAKAADGAARDACHRSGCREPRRTDGEHAAARLFINLPGRREDAP